MGIEVTVLRVFTDLHGNFGNPLGVVDASKVEPADRQRLATQLGYSETIFIDLPAEEVTTAPEWAPEYALLELGSLEALFADDPDDFPDDVAHYLRLTDYLSRDLTITQGEGSVIETTWSAAGWVGWVSCTDHGRW